MEKELKKKDEAIKKRDEQVDKLIKKINEKIEAMRKVLDGYATQIKKWEETPEVKKERVFCDRRWITLKSILVLLQLKLM